MAACACTWLANSQACSRCDALQIYNSVLYCCSIFGSMFNYYHVVTGFKHYIPSYEPK